MRYLLLPLSCWLLLALALGPQTPQVRQLLPEPPREGQILRPDRTQVALLAPPSVESLKPLGEGQPTQDLGPVHVQESEPIPSGLSSPRQATQQVSPVLPEELGRSLRGAGVRHERLDLDSLERLVARYLRMEPLFERGQDLDGPQTRTTGESRTRVQHTAQARAWLWQADPLTSSVQ